VPAQNRVDSNAGSAGGRVAKAAARKDSKEKKSLAAHRKKQKKDHALDTIAELEADESFVQHQERARRVRRLSDVVMPEVAGAGRVRAPTPAGSTGESSDDDEDSEDEDEDTMDVDNEEKPVKKGKKPVQAVSELFLLSWHLDLQSIGKRKGKTATVKTKTKTAVRDEVAGRKEAKKAKAGADVDK
jgi:hypothetical protein